MGDAITKQPNRLLINGIIGRGIKMNTREFVVAVQRNGDGDLTAFRTNTGRTLNYSDALQAVSNGEIAGVNIFKGRDGGHYIRGDADGDPSNNLDNLPTF